MKKLFLLIAIIGFGIVSYAQQVNDYMEVTRAALKTEKKAMNYISIYHQAGHIVPRNF